MGASFAANGDVVVPNQAGSAVYTYKPELGATPYYTLTSADISGPSDTVVGSDGRIYVLNMSSSAVTVFPGESAGFMPALRTIPVTGANELYSVALDEKDHVYVAGFSGGVVVYPAGTGSIPLVRLSGPVSKLAGVTSMLVDPQRRVVVSELPGRVATFSPLVPFALPGAVRALAVSGAKTAKKRVVTWTVPTSAGDRPVTSYVVTVRKGTRTVLTRAVSERRLVLKRKKLPAGKLKVAVVARSAAGSGPAVTVRFTVKRPK
jgi:hypothetical protein